MPNRRALIMNLLVVVVFATACGGSGDGVVTVADSWAPSTPPGAGTAAVYLTITNGTGDDDRLLAVSSDRCAAIELHSTQIDDNQIMRMRQAGPELLVVPARGDLRMVPGGLHVMCIDMPTPFVAGEEIAMTVTFERTGSLPVTAVVENR
ncbi:MAG: copper chaperone PCu(A)C [Actinomycetota bacterium]|nr:copper chaperone PCu(A)C [Actinomycetota bacterium]